jgi:ABC-type polysaccharide/polyol phosphate transport system ATPase subunit
MEMQPDKQAEPEEAVVRCEHVGLTFRVPESRQKVKDVIMSGGRALRRREFPVLQDVSFALGQSEVLGVIGHNGAGKSTLLRVIGGIYRPDTGVVSVEGRIGMLMELGAGFHPELSGRENIQLNASLIGVEGKLSEERINKIVSWAGLEDFMEMQVCHYSSGMKARLGFAVAVEIRPEVLLVDEVLSVGDADFRQKCDLKFQEFIEQGTTIVIVSHSMQSIEKLCTKVLWMDKGLVRGIGPTADVLDEYRKALRASQSQVVQESQEARKKKEEEEARRRKEAEEAERKRREEEEQRKAKENAFALEHPSDNDPALAPKAPAGEKRSGLGGLRIDGIILRGKDGAQKYAFDYKEYMRFDLRYSMHRAVQRPMFGIQLRTLEGAKVSGANTLVYDFEVEQIGKYGVLAMEIPESMLAPGSYLVSAYAFTIEDGQRINFDLRENLALFDVVSGPRWVFGPTLFREVKFRNFADPKRAAQSQETVPGLEVRKVDPEDSPPKPRD